MVSDEVLKAVARLEGDPDFRIFMDEVQRRREAARDELEVATDPWLAGRAQGTANLAGEMQKLVREARQSIAKRQGR
jgi:hypothetical protein